MTMQSANTKVGFAKQSARGTAATNPTFDHGLASGGFTTTVEQEPAELASGVRYRTHVDRTKVQPGFDMASRAFIKSIGLWLLGALGAVNTTGAGPYVHTFTPGSALPWLTVWGWLDSTYYNAKDCIVESLELTWSETNPLEMNVSGSGGLINFSPTYTPGTSEVPANYLVPVGGTFKYDVDSATPVTGRIKGGSIKINNGLDSIMLSGSVVPDETFPNAMDLEVSLTVVPDNLNDFRTILTGTSGGTVVQETPVYGSCELTFKEGNAGTGSLKVECLRLPFLTDFPEGNASGGPVEMELTGTPIMQTGGGVPISCVLTNGQTTY